MASNKNQERWRRLMPFLRWDRPPDDMQLYVPPPNSSAEDIASTFLADPLSMQKFLLVGARGGGKSTELRAIAQKLAPHATLATIDLDASGVSPGSLSAFDLLYISGLALLKLKLLPEHERERLYTGLVKAYAGNASDKLGSVNEALSGLVSFAEATEKAAAAMGIAGEPISSGMLGVLSQGLRLFSGQRKELVNEASPEGRTLQAACREIARQVHATGSPVRPICVLIDGLEKMNGEANERFNQVFCYTRLLADAEWSAVIAAPPSTLTVTSSAGPLGYRIVPVYGFGPEHRSELVKLLSQRIEAANIGGAHAVIAEQDLGRLAEASGGLPRYAIQMTRMAVEAAHKASSERIEPAHVDHGIGGVAETLALGLTDTDWRTLRSVQRRGRLPGDERAARLFADGRILAQAPRPGHRRPYFLVHPVLEPELDDLEEDDKPGSVDGAVE